MEQFLRLVHPLVCVALLAIVALVVWMRLTFHKPIVYCYTLATTIAKAGFASKHPYKKIFFGMRLLALAILAILIARPQLVDTRSQVSVDGIDIVLVLDVSGSMQFSDYKDDRRMRIDVAKHEAKRFIRKRENDAIGLVLFANDAVSRCPLTIDKSVLIDMIDQTKLGLIDPDGTRLFTGMITAANRLKRSKAKSKIMILLTDGEPTRETIDKQTALDVVKQLGIKVYTIGIGSEKQEWVVHPWYGTIPKPRINKALLTTIAHETGGKFFNVGSAADMRAVYDEIDNLEKTENQMNVFSNFYDIFVPFAWLVLALIMAELILSSLWWYGL